MTKVREYLERRLSEAFGAIHASANEALAWYAMALRADPAHAYKDGKLLPVDQWPAELRAVVKAVKEDGFTLESKLQVATRLLEIHGKLKNPLTETADVLADALRQDLEAHGRHE